MDLNSLADGISFLADRDREFTDAQEEVINAFTEFLDVIVTDEEMIESAEIDAEREDEYQYRLDIEAQNNTV